MTSRVTVKGQIFGVVLISVDDFSAKLKPPRSFYNTAVYSYLLLHVHSKVKFREI